jgi:uncharacterized membrane protein YccC
MFRDWGVCWILSLGFEVLECTLQFLIPEFKECWWDSLLIDVLGANLLGMGAGWLTLQVWERGTWENRKERMSRSLSEGIRRGSGQRVGNRWRTLHRVMPPVEDIT